MSSVLITGANRGLGLEFAGEYAADGWQVFAACRNPAKAEQLKDLAQKAGDRVWRRSAQVFLETHASDLGSRSTLNIDALLEQV